MTKQHDKNEMRGKKVMMKVNQTKKIDIIVMDVDLLCSCKAVFSFQVSGGNDN